MIGVGARAPDFRVPDQDGSLVSLDDLAGRRVLLAFYPQDFSPVCTDQLTVYEERLGDLRAAGVDLYGVSVDSAFCHAAFRRHLGVSMPLLADFHPKGQVARAFGLYSDTYGVSGRALVLIGPDGTVEWTHRPETPLEFPSIDLVFQAFEARAA